MENAIELAANALKRRITQHRVNHEKGNWRGKKVELYRPTWTPGLSAYELQSCRDDLVPKRGHHSEVSGPPASLSGASLGNWVELNALVEPLEGALQYCLSDIKAIPLAYEHMIEKVFIHHLETNWDYKKECGKLYRILVIQGSANSARFAHALETFETEVSFSVATTLKGPPGWSFGSDSSLGLAALYNNEDCDEWRKYKDFVKLVLRSEMRYNKGRFAPDSLVVGYHVAKALKEVLESALKDVQTYQQERDDIVVQSQRKGRRGGSNTGTWKQSKKG